MATISRHDLDRCARNEVITAARLRALGLTRGQIRTLVRREHLYSAHAGVYFLSAHPPRVAVWTAAVAACGPTALLSHWSAAALWGLMRDGGGLPHVLVASASGGGPKGVMRHRTTRPSVRAERSLIPVTALERTIDDCSRSLAAPGIKRLLRQAELHHSLDLARLEATSAKLEQVLRSYVAGQGKTDSELEADFFELSARADLPIPLLQRAVPGGRADFVYPTLSLIVELDGYATHRGRVAFREDRARDRANAKRGYETMRFTWEDVVVEPQVVADDLWSAASRRSTVSSTAS
jgi:hypothetical protein